jgi:hypothetical protein
MRTAYVGALVVVSIAGCTKVMSSRSIAQSVVAALLIVVCSLSTRALGNSRASQVGCAQREETSAPTAFDDPHFRGRAYRLVIGPLELRNVATYASPQYFRELVRRNGYVDAKAALVVLARRSLELTVRGTDPKPVLLAYGPAPTPTLLVKSCPANTRARTRPGVVRSGTVFTGVFKVPVAECVTLTITNRATKRVWRTRLPFGHRCSA